MLRVSTRWVEHTATHCNTLKHIATHCSTLHNLHHSAIHCNTLHYTATHCNTQTRTYSGIQCHLKGINNTRQHTATHWNTLHHIAPHLHNLFHDLLLVDYLFNLHNFLHDLLHDHFYVFIECQKFLFSVRVYVKYSVGKIHYRVSETCLL